MHCSLSLRRSVVAAVVLALAVAGPPTAGHSAAPAGEPWIASGLPAAAERHLRDAVAAADGCDRIWGLLALHRGRLVVEAYYNGMDADTPINLKSVTKSLNSAMVGVAIDRGWIGGLDDPVARYLPQAFDGHPDKQRITVRHLLTMSSGLPVVPYGRFQRQPDWVAALLEGPLRHPPGERFHYDTPHTHLVTALVARAAGMPARRVADRYLLAPLGGRVADWRTGPRGIHMGGNDAYLLPRHLIRLGELYRLGGVYGGRRVLPADWVERSLRKQIDLPDPKINHGTLDATGYGLLWWLLDVDGEAAVAALGHGGQELIVFPRRELVVLLTSRWRGPSSSEHYRHLQRVLKEHLLPAFTPVPAAS